jgi:hypothetical protein
VVGQRGRHLATHPASSGYAAAWRRSLRGDPLTRSSIAFAPVLVSAGFFFSTLSPRAERPNGAIALVYLGAVGAVTLGVGLL